MENYIVSARKYRPATFNSVVGQKALTATLKNSISKNRLAHAYLFCGSRGVGKTSCARIFAKTINCRNRTPDGEACNECDSCREFNRGASVNIVELDAASNNGVEDMRSITEQVQVPPVEADYRVFIIDEVHMLSSQAFNAFLKTLEEPPSYVIFILATTEKHKIIPTILSRCQIYDFNRITIQDMVEHLKYVASQEGIAVETSALNVIAKKADGAMRDALSIFDQVAASSMGNVTYASTIENLNILDDVYYNKLVDAFLSGDVPSALLTFQEIREKGFDSQFFINGLAAHLRDLMVAGNPSTLKLLDAGDDVRNAMAEIARKCSPQFLYRAMDLCNEADLNYRTASNKQFLVELTLIKLCQLLSPSPGNDDAGEGRQLRPIEVSDVASSNDAKRDVPPVVPQHPPVAPRRPIASQPPMTKKGDLSKLKKPNLSINRKAEQKQEAGSAVAEVTDRLRNSQFSDEQFLNAWRQFIASHPTSHLLINAMRMTRPSRVSETTYSATVESEAIRDSIQLSLPELLAYLRDALSNDAVEVQVHLNKGQSSVTSLTDAEVYAIMRKNHPYLNKVIDDFHLTLV
ncbi:MAG: DNA polymerase III subunit gamma/tau [Muribaculum sp.]|nr:DNA polymerase III subunit gamma/tau [Muribaculum sp.]